MSEAKPGPLRRLWNGFWGIVDGTRRGLFNAIFLVFVIFVVFALFGWGAPKTEPGTALMLAPKGAIVEQYSADPGDRVIAKLTGDEILEVQLRDVLRALEAAKSDPNIDLVVVRTEQFAGAGLATLREIGRAMKQVREAGKEIIAYGDYFDQRGYYLAAHADKIYLSPNGGVLLQGLGRYRSYYAALLDKLKVDIHVFRVGTYKSAVEPYLLNGPSEAAREADQAWLDDLWQIYLADVSEAPDSSAAGSSGCRSWWKAAAATWPSWRWTAVWSMNCSTRTSSRSCWPNAVRWIHRPSARAGSAW